MVALSSKRTARRAYRRLGLALGGLVLAGVFMMPAPLVGEDQATITGRVLNGTSGAGNPSGIGVTLHIFGGDEEVDISSTMTDGEGRFRFREVEPNDDFVYAVTATYLEVLYSSRVDPLLLSEPVELTVYETTSSIESVRVGANVLLIGSAGQDKKQMSAFEVVRLENDGDRTFVADLDQPGSMNFLRFSVAAGATDLNVSSDLPGGDILTVGSGFAITSPVTPGPHQVSYTYRIPYSGTRMELRRSFPMGADTFRLLLEDGLGELRSTGTLTPQSRAEAEGKSFNVWGATQLTPGARLDVELSDLPQPPLLRRVGDAFTDGAYLKVGIPGAVALVLGAVLIYATVLRQPRQETAAASGPRTTMPLPLDSAHGSQPEVDRSSLVEAIAQLDERFQLGEIGEEDFRRHRYDLKARLMRDTHMSGRYRSSSRRGTS